MSEEPRDKFGRPLRTAKSRVRTSAFRQIISRVWYLMIPLFGMVCSKDAYVRPHLVRDENVINTQRVETDEVRDSLLAIVNTIDSETAVVEAEIDSTWNRQVALFRSVLDSLLAVRAEYDVAVPVAEQQVDSLEAVLAEVQSQLQLSSAELQNHQLTIEELKETRRQLQDSIEVITEDIAELADVYDRLANPDKYRKNTALIPGPGNYPNRDAIPER
jgi:hypothetical protein